MASIYLLQGDELLLCCTSEDGVEELDSSFLTGYMLASATFSQYVKRSTIYRGGLSGSTAATAEPGVRALADQADGVSVVKLHGLCLSSRPLGEFSLVAVAPAGWPGVEAYLLAKTRLIVAALTYTCGPASDWARSPPDFGGVSGNLVKTILRADSGLAGRTIEGSTSEIRLEMKTGGVGASADETALKSRNQVVGMLEGFARARVDDSVRAKLKRALGELRERIAMDGAAVIIPSSASVMFTTLSATDTTMAVSLLRSNKLKTSKVRVSPVYTQHKWRQMIFIRMKTSVLVAVLPMQTRWRDAVVPLDACEAMIDSQLPSLPYEEFPLYISDLVKHDSVLLAAVKDTERGDCIVPQVRPGARPLAEVTVAAFCALVVQVSAAVRSERHFAIADSGGTSSALSTGTARPGSSASSAAAGAYLSADMLSPRADGAPALPSPGTAASEVGHRLAESTAQAAATPLASQITIYHGHGFILHASLSGDREVYLLCGSPLNTSELPSLVAEVAAAAFKAVGTA